jgi:hypothetical protein
MKKQLWPMLLLTVVTLAQGGCNVERTKYEIWEYPDGPNGEKNQQIFKVGGLAPEIQKHAKKIPMSPEMEEDLTRFMERLEAENQKPDK